MFEFVIEGNLPIVHQNDSINQGYETSPFQLSQNMEDQMSGIRSRYSFYFQPPFILKYWSLHGI